MTFPEALSLYAALVSSALAGLRFNEWLRSRERLHFSVYAAEIFSEDPALKDRPRPDALVISVGNRAPFALHVTAISFRLRRGTALMQLNPPLGTPKLPQRIEPSEGFTWVMEPKNVREALGANGVDEIAQVEAYDGSGRRYARGLTRAERKQLRGTLGPDK